MHRLLSILILFCLFCTARAETQRVLFIGNSYTYCNNLPGIVQAMADATDTDMEVDAYTAGAMSLRGFMNTPQHAKAAQKLAEGGYDWVVLQDQSETPASNPADTLGSVKRWCQLASKSNTKVLLFITWAHADVVNNKLRLQTAMQDDTTHTYCRAAVENKVSAAPVGEAWRRWYRKYPTRILHTQDLSHPNAEGSYLAACVLFSSLTSTPATKIPARLRSLKLPIANGRIRELQKCADSLQKFSPKKWLQQYDEKDAARPTAAEARAILTRGMSIEQLSSKLGKPISSQKTGSQSTYQFRLRSKAELTAYCIKNGTVEKVSIASPESGVSILDLAEL